MSLIAEIKRHSPSVGAIKETANPAEFAGNYEAGGARALSVLTEPFYFHGSDEDLIEARAACALPVLRKDFVIDPYQIIEARAIGADAVLLIVAVLRKHGGLLAELASAAKDYQLAALVEIHTKEELEVALAINPDLIGINKRNLTTFEVQNDSNLAVGLRAEIPSEIATVAESGIRSRVDVEVLEEANIDGVLVGGTLMDSEDPRKTVASLLGN